MQSSSDDLAPTVSFSGPAVLGARGASGCISYCSGYVPGKVSPLGEEIGLGWVR